IVRARAAGRLELSSGSEDTEFVRRRSLLVAVALAAVLLVFPLGSATALSEPPNVTGTWTPTTGGTWQLTASGPGLVHLHADWQGIGAHSQLHGSFDGGLNAAGDEYVGSFDITENGNEVGGTMTFHIDSLTQLTVTF